MGDDNPYLKDLGLSRIALSELQYRGYERVGDLKHLSNVDLLTVHGVGGASYKRIVAALGRKPWSTKKYTQRDWEPDQG
jgi:DNA-directed RNA polymerase alpha subunit